MGMVFGSGASVVGLEKILWPPCLAVAAANCWWHCAHLCHWAQFQHGWVFGGLFWLCGNIYKNNLGRVIASWLQIWQVYIYHNTILHCIVRNSEYETRGKCIAPKDIFIVQVIEKERRALITNINICKMFSCPKRSGGILCWPRWVEQSRRDNKLSYLGHRFYSKDHPEVSEMVVTWEDYAGVVVAGCFVVVWGSLSLM